LGLVRGFGDLALVVSTHSVRVLPQRLRILVSRAFVRRARPVRDPRRRSAHTQLLGRSRRWQCRWTCCGLAASLAGQFCSSPRSEPAKCARSGVRGAHQSRGGALIVGRLRCDYAVPRRGELRAAQLGLRLPRRAQRSVEQLPLRVQQPEQRATASLRCAERVELPRGAATQLAGEQRPAQRAGRALFRAGLSLVPRACLPLFGSGSALLRACRTIFGAGLPFFRAGVSLRPFTFVSLSIEALIHA
jgi:hypothetical protein